MVRGVRSVFVRSAFAVSLVFGLCSSALPHGLVADAPADTMLSSSSGGIREDVPKRFRPRFDKWKSELLVTPYGKQAWERFAGRRDFTLTIRVSEERGKGAATDKFVWDDDGNLVAATITLGTELDGGVPPPVYYPVLNALSQPAASPSIRPTVFAAAKLIHEIGHVEQAAAAAAGVLEKESRLVPKYIEIFLNNGLDANDRRLLDLRQQLGGTPTQLWEEREYNSEVVAMRYVTERLSDEDLCLVLHKVRENLETYGSAFESKFDLAREFASAACRR